MFTRLCFCDKVEYVVSFTRVKGNIQQNVLRYMSCLLVGQLSKNAHVYMYILCYRYNSLQILLLSLIKRYGYAHTVYSLNMIIILCHHVNQYLRRYTPYYTYCTHTEGGRHRGCTSHLLWNFVSPPSSLTKSFDFWPPLSLMLLK